MASDVVVLHQQADEEGTVFVRARITREGALEVSGQDIGRAVESLWGSREYEWAVTIAPQHHALLEGALGHHGGTDPLGAVAAAFTGPAAIGFRSFCESHGVPHEFWSRVGD